MSALGSNIKFLRKLKGISQQKLAQEVGLKRNNIASYESGAVEPRSINFLKLAHFFEVDPVHFFTKELSQEPLAASNEENEDQAILTNMLIAQLENLITDTTEAQKVVDGFRELQKFRSNNQKNYSEPFPMELINLIDIAENLLDANWKVAQKAQQVEEN